MSELIKYKVTFQKTQIRIRDDELTFTIGKIRSRRMSVAFFRWYGYDLRGNLIARYAHSRWVITSDYTMKTKTFTIPFYTNPDTNKPYLPEDVDTFVIELYFVGVDSENPVYFNRLQLNEGAYKEYHQPNEAITNVSIGFNRNRYVNLYDNDSSFLQIIRPLGEEFTTEVLTPSKTTILAPHLADESSFDTPSALFYEYMYMTEQRIGVEK